MSEEEMYEKFKKRRETIAEFCDLNDISTNELHSFAAGFLMYEYFFTGRTLGELIEKFKLPISGAEMTWPKLEAERNENGK